MKRGELWRVRERDKPTGLGRRDMQNRTADTNDGNRDRYN